MLINRELDHYQLKIINSNFFLNILLNKSYNVVKLIKIKKFNFFYTILV